MRCHPCRRISTSKLIPDSMLGFDVILRVTFQLQLPSKCPVQQCVEQVIALPRGLLLLAAHAFVVRDNSSKLALKV